MLTIPPQRKCDFIRWHLVLEKTFSLQIEFGEARPNTRGFVPIAERRGPYDGELIQLTGAVGVARTNGRETLRLTSSDNGKAQFSIARLNDNIFHVLSSDGNLMIGNGGWSYTLNRENPVASSSAVETGSGRRTTTPRAVFVGRTPCRELGELFAPATGCLKLKWRLTLDRDPMTMKPTTYKLEGTLYRTQTIEGKWETVAPNVLRLENRKPVTLLAVEDLLFFLDQNGVPMTGNNDFSFTLNRRTGVD